MVWKDKPNIFFLLKNEWISFSDIKKRNYKKCNNKINKNECKMNSNKWSRLKKLSIKFFFYVGISIARVQIVIIHKINK